MLLWVMPAPAPWAKTNSACASPGRNSSPDTVSPPTRISSTSMPLGGGGFVGRIPPSRQLARRLDVGGEVDFAPFLARDVEREHVMLLRDLVDDAQIPDSGALGRADGAVDILAEQLRAAAAERQQADRLGIDEAELEPFADRLQAP